MINRWANRNHKIKQKEVSLEKEIKGYFKPQISKSSKRLALKKKKEGIVTGGKTIQNGANTNSNALEDRFERLYNDSKKRTESKQEIYNQKQQPQEKPKVVRKKPTQSKSKLSIENPSFHSRQKASPLASSDNLCQLSSEVDEEKKTQFIINKYMNENIQVANKDTKSSMVAGGNFLSSGLNSP